MMKYFIDYSLFNIITKQRLCFPVLYNISWLLIYFKYSKLYPLIQHPYLDPPHSPFPTGNYYLVFYTCVSDWVLLYNLACFYFLDSMNKL